MGLFMHMHDMKSTYSWSELVHLKTVRKSGDNSTNFQTLFPVRHSDRCTVLIKRKGCKRPFVSRANDEGWRETVNSLLPFWSSRTRSGGGERSITCYGKLQEWQPLIRHRTCVLSDWLDIWHRIGVYYTKTSGWDRATGILDAKKNPVTPFCMC